MCSCSLSQAQFRQNLPRSLGKKSSRSRRSCNAGTWKSYVETSKRPAMFESISIRIGSILNIRYGYPGSLSSLHNAKSTQPKRLFCWFLFVFPGAEASPAAGGSPSDPSNHSQGASPPNGVSRKISGSSAGSGGSSSSVGGGSMSRQSSSTSVRSCFHIYFFAPPLPFFSSIFWCQWRLPASE